MKQLVLIAIFLVLTAPAIAQDGGQNRVRVERSILRNFPLDVIWAQVALNVALKEGKILQLREFFQPYWYHRNQILDKAADGDREKLRERLNILRDRFNKELPKHLTQKQIDYLSVFFLEEPRPESREQDRSLDLNSNHKKSGIHSS